MDKVTRYITKRRESGFVQTFAFSTWSIVFNQMKWPENKDARAVLEYLQKAFLNGLDRAPESPSQMPELIIETRKVYKSPLCDMAKKSGARGCGKNQHAVLQNYFMQNHSDCIAVECPVSDGKTEGCIDILLLCLDPFKVTILDYKPNSAGETKAATQLYYYLKGLIAKTGLDKGKFDLFYFDEENCFEVIKPNIIK